MNQKKTTIKKINRPTPPRAVREYTSGGVVFRRRGEDVDILMLEDYRGRWTIPKGHVEDGEKLGAAALREVQEETGLSQLKLMDWLGKIYFFYRGPKGKLIFMTNHVYLIEAVGDTEALHKGDSEGIKDVKWFASREAIERVAYRETKKLFRQALERIKTK